MDGKHARVHSLHQKLDQGGTASDGVKNLYVRPDAERDQKCQKQIQGIGKKPHLDGNCKISLSLAEIDGDLVLCPHLPSGGELQKEEKQDETKPIPWEVADPKPPVIQSGRLQQRKVN